MIMLNSCALNRPWDVKEALWVWKKRLRTRQRMRPEESGKGGGGSEAEPVGSSIKERIEPAWGDPLDRGGFLLGVEILCGLPKKLGTAIGWGRTRGNWANEENKPEDKRAQWQCI